ncbi:MAG: DHH family phosphoesterase [Candidatus Nanopelagicales bacterium]
MSWDQAPADEDWQRLVDSLNSASSVLLIAHVSPDGDALGSAMAAGLAMRQLGIPAVVSFDGEPFELPLSLNWMPGKSVLSAPAEIPSDLDVAVSFDAGSLDRLGQLADNAASAKLFAALDHHRSFTGFAEICLVDVTAPATAVLALELVDRLGAEVTAEIAACLYAGLTTDTGSFRFAGTTAETHRMAARLHEAGIAHDQIARAVFDSQPYAAVQLAGLAISRSELRLDAAGGLGVVSSWVSADDRAAAGLPLDAAEPIIDSLRTANEAEVAVVLKQGDDSVWRVSTRSKGQIDVGLVCSGLGGGGHRFAAGYSSAKQPEAILSELLAALAEQAAASAG